MPSLLTLPLATRTRRVAWGAILAQIDAAGKFYVIAYASRKLQKYEKNYTPFLLEMQAAIFGMETFEVNLRGWHFKLS